MKKFTVNCDFGGQIAPFAVYIGVPESAHHPLHFQAEWLSKNRGGSIPPEIMEAVGRLKEIADKNGVSLEELCVYALGAAQQEKDQNIDNNELQAPAAHSTAEEDDFDFDFDDLVMSPSTGSLDSNNEATDEDDNLEVLNFDELLNTEVPEKEIQQSDDNKINDESK